MTGPEGHEATGPLLSLAMIVRDEAQDIGACLDAAGSAVDEIVVVDTGSTDDTARIAASKGAAVHHETWQNDFARARNAARERCRGRWIVSLDADERLDYMNAHRLRKAIERADGDPSVLALAVTIESEVERQGSGLITRHVFPRAFRNSPSISWVGALHEQVVLRDGNLLAHARLSDVVVTHLGYARPARAEDRRQRNARALESYPEGPRTPFDRLSIAHVEMNFKRFEAAAELFEALLCEGLPRNLESTARWSYGHCLLALGRRHEARRLFVESAERFPAHRSFRYTHAMLDLEDQRPLEARATLEALLAEPNQVLTDETDLLPTRETMETHLARTFLGEGRLIEALRRFEGLAKRAPTHPEVRFQRAQCLAALDRWEEAETLLAKLDGESPGDGPVRMLLDQARQRVVRRHEPGLAVCMIVRDELQRVETLLPSLGGLADEVIVVDTGSEDGTAETAVCLGARVVRTSWSDDFAEARNAAFDAVTKRWVLWLDADERLDRRHWDAVRAIVRDGACEAVSVVLESPHADGDPVGVSRGRYCRLFRADVGARFEGRVHEQILPALERRGCRVVEREIVIEHLGYAMDEATMQRKKARNFDLLQRMAREKPDDYYVWFQLGVTLIALNRFADAIEPLERSARLRHETAPREVAVWTELRLGQARFVTGDLAGCERHARAALAREPRLQMAKYLLAGVWGRRRRPLRALVCLRRILTGPADDLAPMRRELVQTEFDRLASALERAGLLHHVVVR